MKSRFKVLRFIGSAYKLLGVVVMILTVLLVALMLVSAFATPDLFAVVGVTASPVQSMIMQAAAILLGGLVAGITCYAMGEAVSVMLAIEDNTARTAYLLRYLIRETTPPAEEEEPQI